MFADNRLLRVLVIIYNGIFLINMCSCGLITASFISDLLSFFHSGRNLQWNKMWCWHTDQIIVHCIDCHWWFFFNAHTIWIGRIITMRVWWMDEWRWGWCWWWCNLWNRRWHMADSITVRRWIVGTMISYHWWFKAIIYGILLNRGETQNQTQLNSDILIQDYLNLIYPFWNLLFTWT